MGNRFWVVRCSDFDAEYVEKKKSIFIGWGRIGDLRNYKGANEVQTRERIKVALGENYRDEKYATMTWIRSSAGQLYRFAFAIEDKDTILTPIKGTDVILVGEANGDYNYNQNMDYPQIREVKWIERISRADLSVPARNSIDAFSTVFSMDAHSEEITKLLKGEKISPLSKISKKRKGEKKHGPPKKCK